MGKWLPELASLLTLNLAWLLTEHQVQMVYSNMICNTEICLLMVSSHSDNMEEFIQQQQKM